MAVTSIIEGIRAFIITCTLLDASGKVSVDWLGPEATVYSVDPIPTNVILDEYIDGSSDRQYIFAFSSREAFGPDTLQNISNSGFFEAFSAWLETKNAAKQFPELPSGMTATKIYAADMGIVMEASEESARYQIQCVLEYHKGA